MPECRNWEGLEFRAATRKVERCGDDNVIGGFDMPRKWFTLGGAGLLAATLLALPAGPAYAAVACGDVITTSVTLTANLSCPTGPGLVVAGDGVVVDLGGYSVRGDTGVVAIGIEVTGDDVTIRNGTVRNFDKNVVFSSVTGGLAADLVTRNGGAGVIVFDSTTATVERLDGRGHGEAAIAVTASSGVTVDDVVLRSGGHGVLVANSFGTDITGSDIRRMTFGVYASNGSNGTVVTGSEINNNDIGVRSEDSTKTQVRTSRLARNRVGVLYVFAAAGGIIDDSRIVRNLVGIQVGELPNVATGSLIVRDSVARNNDAAGIFVDLPDVAVSVALEDNRVRSNGFATTGLVDSLGNPVDDGIHTVSGVGDVIITGSAADNNADLGIEAVGATDGGGNNAVGNGNPAQCLGVSC